MEGDALIMKKSLKQMITIIFATLMVLANCIVYADTYQNIASSGETLLSVKDVADADRTDANGNTLSVFSKGGYTDKYVSFNSSKGAKITFRINITKRGVYELNLGVAESTGAVGTYGISIDGGTDEEVKATGDGKTMYDVVYNSVSTPVLEEGNHTITVKAVKASVHFSGIKLNFLAGEMELDDVKLNGISVSETSSFSTGTDSIRFYFTEELDEKSVSADTVSLTYEKDGSKQSVDAEIKADGKILIIAIKETLKESVSYTINLNNVKDKYGLTVIEDMNTVFVAESKDISNATVTFDAEIKYGDITINGKYISSEGVGVSGRNVELYINEIGEIPLATAMTGQDGAFTIECSFPENKQSGVYTLILDGDYVITPVKSEVMYITKEKEKELLDSIKEMTLGTQVEEFLSKYEEIMGLDLVNDFVNVPNPMPVYEGLLNKLYEDVTKLQKEFYTYIALETINQATEEGLVDMVLSSQEDCKLLGIDYDRIHLIESYYNEYIKAVLNLDTQNDVVKFQEAVSSVTEMWLAKEYGYSDVEIEETDKTVYKGQGIEISLGFTEKVSNLKSALLKISVSDADMIEHMIYEAYENVSFELESADKVVSVNAVYNGEEDVKDLGIMYFTAPEAGDYTVTINGTVVFEENENLLLTTNIIEKVIDVTINKTPSSGGNSGGSGGSSSGRGSSIGASMSISEYKEQLQQENKENEQKTYRFNDISIVSWAEESIYLLL